MGCGAYLGNLFEDLSCEAQGEGSCCRCQSAEQARSPSGGQEGPEQEDIVWDLRTELSFRVGDGVTRRGRLARKGEPRSLEDWQEDEDLLPIGGLPRW